MLKCLKDKGFGQLILILGSLTKNNLFNKMNTIANQKTPNNRSLRFITMNNGKSWSESCRLKRFNTSSHERVRLQIGKRNWTRVRMVEMKEADLLKKSLEASNILGEAFDCLKNLCTLWFQDAAEEIHFFKNVKPRLCAYLIYYHTIYNIEMNRPLGSVELSEDIWQRIGRYTGFHNKRLDFYRYWRSGSSSLDDIYFRRGKTDMVLYMNLSISNTIRNSRRITTLK